MIFAIGMIEKSYSYSPSSNAGAFGATKLGRI
jgi:hypothetical protein